MQSQIRTSHRVANFDLINRTAKAFEVCGLFSNTAVCDVKMLCFPSTQRPLNKFVGSVEVKSHIIEHYRPRPWWVVIFTLRSLYHRGKSSQYVWGQSLSGHGSPVRESKPALRSLANSPALAVHMCVFDDTITLVYFHIILQNSYNLKNAKPEPRIFDNITFVISAVCILRLEKDTTQFQNGLPLLIGI